MVRGSYNLVVEKLFRYKTAILERQEANKIMQTSAAFLDLGNAVRRGEARARSHLHATSRG